MTISGKDLAARLKARMAEQVATFPAKYGRVPHLVVILVGDDPGSQTYVKNKAKACDVVGIRNTTVRMPGDTPEQELLDKIGELNADDTVDGILVSFLFRSRSASRRLSKPYPSPRMWMASIRSTQQPSGRKDRTPPAWSLAPRWAS